ncbi:hypothetical protein B0T22DRAFT_437998 [Podospora appendiculata]|uniref:Ankyrin repeat protein n=1 Tax=Podospora appendiculata TaxID=314037 RepID=A0AAE0XK86_9PEZI|nr:hypothetical protein B0T22DRAFT_437998 [Podospora appendiculata]
MSRVENGKIAKPRGQAQARKRGRPAIDWTQSRKRRLLRLYLCTPESELSLKDILNLLAEGDFQPKPRHTQCLLNELLSKSYRQKRPRNRQCMEERMTYLRSIRDGRTRKCLSPTLRPEVVATCSILLTPNPTERRAKWPSGMNRQLAEHSGTHSPTLPESSTATLSTDPQTPDFSEQATSFLCDDADMSPPSHRTFKRLSNTREERRRSRMESLRDMFPTRTPSFLADVASLLSGLSIRSSVSSPALMVVQRQSLKGSFAREQENETLTVVDGSQSRSTQPFQKQADQDTCWDKPNSNGGDSSNSSSSRSKSSSNASPRTKHTRENRELVKFCCSKTPWCLHQRINAVLLQGRPAETFVCTADEVNRPDGLGNIALHFAARWGAPGAILFQIMTLTSNLGATNHRHESFLHVLDPAALSPNELAHFTKYLASRKFNFCQLDRSRRTFAERLLARSTCSIQCLEAIFSYLSEADRLMLLRHQSGPNRQLINSIRARLSHGAVDPAQIEATDVYCEYFTARYDTEYHTNWMRPSLFCHVPVDDQGRNNLHQIIAAMNVGKNLCPPTNEDICSLYNDVPHRRFLRVLALALSSSAEDINNREGGTHRTPLMTLLVGFSWGNHPEQAMAEAVAALLARGAAPEYCDIDGNNALHYAAKLGLLRAAILLHSHRPQLRMVLNNRGETPLDLALRCMEVRLHLPTTDAVRNVARHADVVLFLETGVVVGEEM